LIAVRRNSSFVYSIGSQERVRIGIEKQGPRLLLLLSGFEQLSRGLEDGSGFSIELFRIRR
jgi:hypothetical protein